jgi:hypothetical protein
MAYRFGAYLHPWDLGWLEDRGGMSTLRELGFADVAFPASYHAGTWTTPVGGKGLMRRLEDGVVYFRSGDGYGELQPRPCPSMPGDGNSALQECIERSNDAGLESHAWTVLFHNSRLGRLHSDSCARNAVGDVYEYSLCPARPEVQQYGLQLVTDVAAHEGLTCVEVEAMGFMGYRHGGHHVKSSFVVDPYLDFLMSFCFCDHCKTGLGALNVDGDELQDLVAGLLRRLILDGDAMSPQRLSWQDSFDRLAAGLGRQNFLAMIRHRTMVYVGFLTKLRAKLREGVRLSVHLNMDPLFSGSQIGQPFHSVASMVDEIIVTHYGEPPMRMVDKWAGQKNVGRHTRIAIWPKSPEYNEDKDIVAAMNLVEERKLDGLRIYHLGLLPWRTVERVMKVLTK